MLITLEVQGPTKDRLTFSHPAPAATSKARNWSHFSVQIAADAELSGLPFDEMRLLERRLAHAVSDATQVAILASDGTIDLARTISQSSGARIVSIFPDDDQSVSNADISLGGAGIAVPDSITNGVQLQSHFAPNGPLVELLETVLWGDPNEEWIDAQLQAFNVSTQTAPSTQTLRPRQPGNAWMLERHGTGLRYMSDRWAGRTIGYIERDGITLAETPCETTAIVAIGDWAGLPRPTQERFPWHVVDAQLDGYAANMQARNHGVDHAIRREARGYGLQSVTAVDLPCASSVPKDFAASGAIWESLDSALAEMMARRATFDQSVYVDRLCLGLLAGASDIDVDTAKTLYRNVIAQALERIHHATGQHARPIVVVTQGAGTRFEGRSGAIVAEHALEHDHPASTYTIAGPAYPYPLMSGMPATPTPEARLIMDEIECHAVAAKQEGERWFCPSLRFATLDGKEIIAEFTSLRPLVLDEDAVKAGRHGFRLAGCTNAAHIETVQVISADKVKLVCDKPPANAALAYAWGFESDGSQDRTANHGALRDDWQESSRSVAGQMLYRYALAGVVDLQPMQTQNWKAGGRR